MQPRHMNVLDCEGCKARCVAYGCQSSFVAVLSAEEDFVGVGTVVRVAGAEGGVAIRAPCVELSWAGECRPESFNSRVVEVERGVAFEVF